MRNLEIGMQDFATKGLCGAQPLINLILS